MITASALAKCLLIGGAGVATGTGIYYIQNSFFSNDKKLEELAKNVGLTCIGKPSETSGVECTKNANVNVKQGDSTSFDLTSQWSGAKIKAYKNEGYENKFKFVIEDGDISAASGGTTNKLEQFETYEIKEDPKGSWVLKRKNEAKTEIKEALGLPKEDTCKFPTNGTEVECTLGTDKIKKVKFDGVTAEPTAKDTSGATITLKISKVSEAPFNGGGYKFVLQSNKEISLGGDKSIKKDTNTEFKIKRENGSLTLEKAWTVKSLGEKVGLVCPETVTGEEGECTLGASINVNNSDSNSDTTKKHTGLTKKNETDSNKKVKFLIGQEGHSQGFKLFTEETNGIELKNGTAASGGSDESSKKIEAKTGESGTFYEIKKDTENKWFLTKKTTTAAG